MTLDIDVESSESQMSGAGDTLNQQEEKKYELDEVCSPIPIISTIFFILKFLISKVVRCMWFIFVKVFTFLHECFSAQRAQLFEYNFSHMFDKNF